MKKIFQILIIVFSGLLMHSCYYDELLERQLPELPTDPDDPNYVEIKYGAEIQPIFNSKCTMCHNSSNKLDLREGVSYNDLVPEYVVAGDADSSVLFITISTGHGNSSIDDRALIKGWINQGAANN